jgi:hypothetical protein
MGVFEWDICSGNFGLYDATGANLDPLLAQGWAMFA